MVSGVSRGALIHMDEEHACALAARLHDGQREHGGSLLLDHVRRVAGAVPDDARVVAWLHESLEHSSISELALIAEGVSHDELQAIRLLTRVGEPSSDAIYLAHVERIARARGPGAGVARSVKRADLADRAAHPSIRPDGWSPPYSRGPPDPG